MSEPPRIQIVSGSPTPEEEEAVREAVLKLWREDQAAAARAADANPWVLAARAEATGGGLALVRARAKRSSWRLSGRFAGPESHIQAGRGDAK
jgi:hypothetical protein